MGSIDNTLGQHEIKLELIIKSIDKLTNSLDKNSTELNKVAMIVAQQQKLLEQLSKLEATYQESYKKGLQRLSQIESDASVMKTEIKYIHKWKWLMISTIIVVVIKEFLLSLGMK